MSALGCRGRLAGAPFGSNRCVGQLKINVDIDAEPAQGVQLDLAVDQEALQKKRRVEPGSVKLDHIQPKLEIRYSDTKPAARGKLYD